MAVITSYTTLVTAIGDYLARSDLTTYIPNFVQNWEERFMREPPNWGSWLETPLYVAVSGGVAAIPSDYLGLKVAYFAGSVGPNLKRVSLDQLYLRFPRFGSTGLPSYISRNGSNFEFGPVSDSGNIAGTYYAKPLPLRSFAADAAAHFLILNAPDLCLYGPLMEAESFLKNDSRVALWGSLYSAALEGYRGRMTAEDYSGSAPHTIVV